jgi:cytochrome P450
MLNVERLMASELVALSSDEVVAAALFLWCRAWKQKPAASLPDDERVMAAFARMPLGRFRKIRPEATRGFVLCSDGRWYHKVLAQEAVKSFARKTEFRRKREADAERLRNWRGKRNETQYETPQETVAETQTETRFVQEGQGRDREGTGKGQGESKKDRHHDDDSLPRKVLARICEIFEVRLQDDPARLTWKNQVTAMLSDGLSEAEIIKATEIARQNGKRSLSYVRAVAMNPKANGHAPSAPLPPGNPEADRAAANAKTKAMLGLT